MIGSRVILVAVLTATLLSASARAHHPDAPLGSDTSTVVVDEIAPFTPGPPERDVMHWGSEQKSVATVDTPRLKMHFPGSLLDRYGAENLMTLVTHVDLVYQFVTSLFGTHATASLEPIQVLFTLIGEEDEGWLPANAADPPNGEVYLYQYPRVLDGEPWGVTSAAAHEFTHLVFGQFAIQWGDHAVLPLEHGGFTEIVPALAMRDAGHVLGDAHQVEHGQWLIGLLNGTYAQVFFDVFEPTRWAAFREYVALVERFGTLPDNVSALGDAYLATLHELPADAARHTNALVHLRLMSRATGVDVPRLFLTTDARFHYYREVDDAFRDANWRNMTPPLASYDLQPAEARVVLRDADGGCRVEVETVGRQFMLDAVVELLGFDALYVRDVPAPGAAVAGTLQGRECPLPAATRGTLTTWNWSSLTDTAAVVPVTLAPQLEWSPVGEVRSGEPVTMTARAADRDGHVARIEWRIFDRTVATGETLQHVFPAPGRITVSVLVTDDDGAVTREDRLVHMGPGGVSTAPARLPGAGVVGGLAVIAVVALARTRRDRAQR